MKNIKKEIPFIITMLIFMIACAIVTAYTIKNEPQYVKVIRSETNSTVSTVETVEAQNTESEEINININTADSVELQLLPGIGETIAGRIIDYREEYGGFLYIEEIMEVSGIGEHTFENIKDLIYVD